MKKIFACMIGIIAMTLFMVSCGGDDNNDEPQSQKVKITAVATSDYTLDANGEFTVPFTVDPASTSITNITAYTSGISFSTTDKDYISLLPPTAKILSTTKVADGSYKALMAIYSNNNKVIPKAGYTYRINATMEFEIGSNSECNTFNLKFTQTISQ